MNNKNISDFEQEMLDTYAQQIAELAAMAVSGGEDVDISLASLIAGAPEGVRSEIIQQFRDLVEELSEDLGEEVKITPQQEELERLHKEKERMLLANWLSQKTLDKIKKAILSNPLVMQNIVSAGEELSKKGILIDNSRQKITNSEIGAVVAQPVGVAQRNDISSVIGRN